MKSASGYEIWRESSENPLIYVNGRFTEITGYPEEKILGENCRFLQGADTNEFRVPTIRQAIDEREPVDVVLKKLPAGRNGILEPPTDHTTPE